MIKLYLQYYGTLLLRNLLKIFNIFPIKKNRLMFYSFNGKQYSCNPKQIAEQLLVDYPNLEIIWAFKNPKLFNKKINKRIRTVKYRSIKYYYLAKTSKIIIQNVQGFGELSRRRNQYVIQTWHASNGYKKQGDCVGIERKIEELFHKDYTHVLSGSESMTERRVRKTMGFSGPVINGTPRMDVIINQNNDEIKKRVYKYFNLTEDTKILLYAPTWRKNRNDNNYGLDFQKLYQTIVDKFDGKWIILVRLHPNVYQAPKMEYSFTYNATDYPDMQDLLYTVDVLISDYSSCIWDFSFTNRPCFLFCPDIDKYGKDRDFDVPISKWRFPLSRNNNELCNLIKEFNPKNYTNQMRLHHKEMGNLEDGKSTERICNLIKMICEE